MLRIQRTSNAVVVFLLSGRIEAEDIVELQRLRGLEDSGREIAFDLRDLIVVDRDAIHYLDRCEAESITFRNCPAYIREWINTERRGSSRRKAE